MRGQARPRKARRPVAQALAGAAAQSAERAGSRKCATAQHAARAAAPWLFHGPGEQQCAAPPQVKTPARGRGRCAVSSGCSGRFASSAQAETGEAETEQRERAGFGDSGNASCDRVGLRGKAKCRLPNDLASWHQVWLTTPAIRKTFSVYLVGLGQGTRTPGREHRGWSQSGLEIQADHRASPRKGEQGRYCPTKLDRPRCSGSRCRQTQWRRPTGHRHQYPIRKW